MVDAPLNHLLVPASRVGRWFENFETRHGSVAFEVTDGVLRARADDGSEATAALPFDGVYAGPPRPADLTEAAVPPDRWGILLVRKGGFAVARIAGETITESKVGQRHVQGRTKAGGQSQQRFARRRDNQATAAYAAAADHAARILTGTLHALVTGGDASAVEAVLADPRLRRVGEVRTSLFLPVPDPRRAVLDGAVADACSVRITVRNA